MTRLSRRLPVALPLIALLASAADAADVSVFAAASLKTALDQIAADYQAASGNTVTISYAGSNVLARQIIEGAPADVFVSASAQWMDEIEKAGLIADGTRQNLLGNTLVLVAHEPSASKVELGRGTDLAGMLAGGKLAMALVDSVPAGQYGKEALTSLGLWSKVEADVAQTDNVRAALALVATGEAPYGIVYASDAAAEPGVHVVGTFPEASHRPIIYPAALLKAASDPADRGFLDAMSSPAADAVFAAQGFKVTN